MAKDRIIVHDLEVFARHGVYPEERREGRRFAVDVIARLSKKHGGTRPAGEHDDLQAALDYRRLAQVVVDVMGGESVQLIETLAERIAAQILSGHDIVDSVEVHIRKYADGVPGEPRWVGVEIIRSRS